MHFCKKVLPLWKHKNKTDTMIKKLLCSLLLISAAEVHGQDFSVFSEGLIGNIQPKGWVKEFLVRQKSGLTGHPEAMACPYNTCLWNGEIRRNSEEYGDDWWRYEQTAYYTDALLRLTVFPWF